MRSDINPTLDLPPPLVIIFLPKHLYFLSFSDSNIFWGKWWCFLDILLRMNTRFITELTDALKGWISVKPTFTRSFLVIFEFNPTKCIPQLQIDFYLVQWFFLDIHVNCRISFAKKPDIVHCTRTLSVHTCNNICKYQGYSVTFLPIIHNVLPC